MNWPYALIMLAAWATGFAMLLLADNRWASAAAISPRWPWARFAAA